MVQALKRKYKNDVTFIVADIDTAGGRGLSEKYEVAYLPTMVFIDAKGNIAYRTEGLLSKDALENKIKELTKGVVTAKKGFFENTLPQYLTEVSIVTFLVAFLGGLATSISPCIVSMLPVLVGYIGGYAQPTKKRGFFMSLNFVLGLATTFAVLGMIASWVGGIFGQIGIAWYYVVAVVAIIMGLQLVGVFNIKFPTLTKMPLQNQGYLASYFMGLFFGLVASPCATPVLAVLITFVAGTGKVYTGALLLFFYGLGHGIPLLIAGTFTAYLKSFQRFQQVGGYITVASGILLVAVGFYFLYLTKI